MVCAISAGCSAVLKCPGGGFDWFLISFDVRTSDDNFFTTGFAAEHAHAAAGVQKGNGGIWRRPKNVKFEWSSEELSRPWPMCHANGQWVFKIHVQ